MDHIKIYKDTIVVKKCTERAKTYHYRAFSIYGLTLKIYNGNTIVKIGLAHVLVMTDKAIKLRIGLETKDIRVFLKENKIKICF